MRFWPELSKSSILAGSTRVFRALPVAEANRTVIIIEETKP